MGLINKYQGLDNISSYVAPKFQNDSNNSNFSIALNIGNQKVDGVSVNNSNPHQQRNDFVSSVERMIFDRNDYVVSNENYQQVRDYLLEQMDKVLNDVGLEIDDKLRSELTLYRDVFQHFSELYNEFYEAVNGHAKRMSSLDVSKETQKEAYAKEEAKLSFKYRELRGHANWIYNEARDFFNSIAEYLSTEQRDKIVGSLATLGYMNYKSGGSMEQPLVLENGMMIASGRLYSLNQEHILSTLENMLLLNEETIDYIINNLHAKYEDDIKSHAPTTPTQKIAEQTADSLVKEMLQNPKTKETKTSEVKV